MGLELNEVVANMHNHMGGVTTGGGKKTRVGSIV